MTSINAKVFDEFHAKNGRFQQKLNDTDPDNAELAMLYFRSLGSKSGNDILEDVAVRATGRTCDPKHKLGADSTDGELEAKPMKCSKSGCQLSGISDDTPNSLLRHHKITWIMFCEASEDGTQINWAILVPYRIFDAERYARMMTEMKQEGLLPEEHSARYAALVQLKSIWPKKKYIRSSSFSMETVKALKPGQYDIWINPAVTVRPEIRQMAEVSKGINAETIASATGFRNFFVAQLDATAQSDDDYSEMSLTKLKQLCRDRKIKGFSNKKKPALIELLTKKI